MSTSEVGLFSQIAGGSAPAAAPQGQNAATSPDEVNMFSQIASTKATPPKQEMTQPGTGAFNTGVQKATDAFTGDLGIKNLISNAKQKWADMQAGRDAEAQMSQQVMEHIKKGNYGQAAEMLLGHIAKTASPGIGIAQDIGGNVVSGGKALAKGEIGEGAGHLMAAGAKVLPFALGGGASEALEGGEAATEGAASEGPGFFKQVLKGKEVAQEPAKAAIRSAAGASEETPLLEGNKTALDETIKGISEKERAAYKAQDEAAGFDVKAMREKMKNTDYQMKQLLETEEDMKKSGELGRSYGAMSGKVAEAEERMNAAGVNPKAADMLFKQRKAAEEFRKAIVQHVSADGDSVNIDGLLNTAKKLRNSKFGDRLEQAFGGKEKADQFMSDLQQAKELGAHAMKMQRIAQYVGGSIGVGAVGELIHAAH
jgi:hypothetical protein